MIYAIILRANIYAQVGPILPQPAAAPQTGWIFGVSRFGQGSF